MVGSGESHARARRVELIQLQHVVETGESHTFHIEGQEHPPAQLRAKISRATAKVLAAEAQEKADRSDERKARERKREAERAAQVKKNLEQTLAAAKRADEELAKKQKALDKAKVSGRHRARPSTNRSAGQFRDCIERRGR